jgi:hypothetical protein
MSEMSDVMFPGEEKMNRLYYHFIRIKNNGLLPWRILQKVHERRFVAPPPVYLDSSVLSLTLLYTVIARRSNRPTKQSIALEAPFLYD